MEKSEIQEKIMQHCKALAAVSDKKNCIPKLTIIQNPDTLVTDVIFPGDVDSSKVTQFLREMADRIEGKHPKIKIR